MVRRSRSYSDHGGVPKAMAIMPPRLQEVQKEYESVRDGVDPKMQAVPGIENAPRGRRTQRAKDADKILKHQLRESNRRASAEEKAQRISEQKEKDESNLAYSFGKTQPVGTIQVDESGKTKVVPFNSDPLASTKEAELSEDKKLTMLAADDFSGTNAMEVEDTPQSEDAEPSVPVPSVPETE